MGKTKSMARIDKTPTLAPPLGADASPADLGIQTAGEIAAMGFEVTRDVTLAPGQGIVGEYIGEGAERELVDPAGEVRTVKVHLFRRGNLRLALLGSAMLDRKLADAPAGAEVAVVNLGRTTTRSGRQLTAWDVGIRPVGSK